MSYDDFSRFYDLLTDNVEYEKRADYFCRLLSMYDIKGGILLDLGCGTGSMSVKMSEKGYDVIGVDISVGMLGVAQQKCMNAVRKFFFSISRCRISTFTVRLIVQSVFSTE